MKKDWENPNDLGALGAKWISCTVGAMAFIGGLYLFGQALWGQSEPEQTPAPEIRQDLGGQVHQK